MKKQIPVVLEGADWTTLLRLSKKMGIARVQVIRWALRYFAARVDGKMGDDDASLASLILGTGPVFTQGRGQ